jgi:hypothetical protein
MFEFGLAGGILIFGLEKFAEGQVHEVVVFLVVFVLLEVA